MAFSCKVNLFRSPSTREQDVAEVIGRIILIYHHQLFVAQTSADEEIATEVQRLPRQFADRVFSNLCRDDRER